MRRRSQELVPQAGIRLARWANGVGLLVCAIVLLGIFSQSGFARLSSEASALAEALVTLGDFSRSQTEVGERLRLISYNLHGPPAGRIDDMLELLAAHNVFVNAGIFALQEVNRDHEGSDHRDVARELARKLAVHFAYAVEIEHPEGGGVRGLALLSRYPLKQVRRVLLPVVGPQGRRRIALGATAELGRSRLRVYTTHLETRISVAERSEQIKAILADANLYENLPTVILGDFNTFTRGATRRMFEIMEEAGFRCPLAGDQKTFQRAVFVRLKLDWIWVRQISVFDSNVEADIALSDHRPLWVDIDVSRLEDQRLEEAVLGSNVSTP